MPLIITHRCESVRFTNIPLQAMLLQLEVIYYLWSNMS